MKSGSLVPFQSGKPEYVLDTWPAMEWLKNRQRVADLFEDCIARALQGRIILWISRINLGEVYCSASGEWGSARAESIRQRLLVMPILYVSASDEAVDAAARLKALYRISYEDAFVAGLAIRQDCPLLSGDSDFRPLESEGILRLEWVGP